MFLSTSIYSHTEALLGQVSMRWEVKVNVLYTRHHLPKLWIRPRKHAPSEHLQGDKRYILGILF